LSLKKTVPVAAGVLLAILPAVLFTAPANSVRSGNELCALSWLLAENRGDGSWEVFPMTITVETGELVTFATVENCGTVSPPNNRLPVGIPFPLDYTQSNGTLTIIFSEVP